MGRRRTEEEVKNILFDLGYGFIEDYWDDENRRVSFYDSNGYKYDAILNNLIRNHIPHFVSPGNKFSLENISLWLKNNIDKIKLLPKNVYINNKTKLHLYCTFCENYVKISWHRIQMNLDCPVCSGHQVDKNKNLLSERPDICRDWSYKYNEKFPEEFSIQSNKKVYWQCSTCGYGDNKEWFVQISNRTGRNETGCPSCSGRAVNNENRLSKCYPKISLEWHPTLNGELTPDNVSYGSSKKVWWLCPNGHEYFSAIYSRKSGRGCKKCSEQANESYLADYLKKYFDEEYKSKSEYLKCKNPKTGMWLPYDIYIPYGDNPDLNGFYIEINGEQHYKLNSWNHARSKKMNTTPEEEFNAQKERDKIKKNFAKKNGTYIEIDIRKFEEPEKAIVYIEKILEKNLFYE